MSELDEIRGLKKAKSLATKNNELTAIIFGLIAFFTVLLPLTADSTKNLYMVIIAFGGFVFSFIVVIAHLHFKYKEYNGDYYMFFSVNYFEKKKRDNPNKFRNDISSVDSVANELANKFRLNQGELFTELIDYYKIDVPETPQESAKKRIIKRFNSLKSETVVSASKKKKGSHTTNK